MNIKDAIKIVLHLAEMADNQSPYSFEESDEARKVVEDFFADVVFKD